VKAFIENLLNRTDHNDMPVNTAKTKMILGRLARSDLPILSTPVGKLSIDRVPAFKLLRVIDVYGIYTLQSLDIDNMAQKATQRSYS